RANALGLTADERIRGVHAFQDSIFLRSFRAGTRVKVTSHIEYIRRTRVGTLVVTQLTSHDAATHDLLCESWNGGILRDVDCDLNEAGTMPPYLASPPDAPPVNAQTAEITTEYSLPYTYTECARIWNPIHTERRTALRAGLP